MIYGKRVRQGSKTKQNKGREGNEREEKRAMKGKRTNRT